MPTKNNSFHCIYSSFIIIIGMHCFSNAYMCSIKICIKYTLCMEFTLRMCTAYTDECTVKSNHLVDCVDWSSHVCSIYTFIVSVILSLCNIWFIATVIPSSCTIYIFIASVIPSLCSIYNPFLQHLHIWLVTESTRNPLLCGHMGFNSSLFWRYNWLIGTSSAPLDLPDPLSCRIELPIECRRLLVIIIVFSITGMLWELGVDGVGWDVRDFIERTFI